MNVIHLCSTWRDTPQQRRRQINSFHNHACPMCTISWTTHIQYYSTVKLCSVCTCVCIYVQWNLMYIDLCMYVRYEGNFYCKAKLVKTYYNTIASYNNR